MKNVLFSQQELALLVSLCVATLVASFFFRRNLEKNKYKKRIPNFEEKITKGSYQSSLTYSFSKKLEMYERFFAHFLPSVIAIIIFYSALSRIYFKMYFNSPKDFNPSDFFLKSGYASIAFIVCSVLANLIAYLKYKNEYKDEILFEK